MDLKIPLSFKPIKPIKPISFPCDNSILETIFSLLSPEQLLKIRSVNKQWLAIANQPYVVKSTLSRIEHDMDSDQFEKIAKPIYCVLNRCRIETNLAKNHCIRSYLKIPLDANLEKICSIGLFSKNGNFFAVKKNNNQEKKVCFWNTHCQPPEILNLSAMLQNYCDIINIYNFQKNLFLLAVKNKTILLTKLTGTQLDSVKLIEHQTKIKLAVLSFNQNFLVTTDNNGTLLLWDLQHKLCPTVILKKNCHQVEIMLFSKKNNFLVIAYHDQTIDIWNLQKNELPPSLLMEKSYFSSVIFSHDENWFIAHKYDKTVTVLNLDLVEIENLNNIKVTQLFCSPNKYWLLVVVSNKWLLYDLRQNNLSLKATLKETHTTIKKVFFSPNDNFLLIEAANHQISLWDLQPNMIEPPKNLNGKIIEKKLGLAAFSPDSRWLIYTLLLPDELTGGNPTNNKVYLLDLRNSPLKKKPISLKGYPEWQLRTALFICFSQDSSSVALVLNSNNVFFWNFSENFDPVSSLNTGIWQRCMRLLKN